MNGAAGRTTLDQKELEDIVSLVLDEAREQGVDQAEAAASHAIGLCATARLGSVESLEYTNDRGVGVTVYKDQKKGTPASAEGLRRESPRSKGPQRQGRGAWRCRSRGAWAHPRR